MDITFAKTRHVYDSYTDFWKLVELSKFPTIYVDEIKLDKPAVYITAPMNGDYRAHVSNEVERIRNDKHTFTQAHLILWNLERPSGSAGSVAQYANDNRQLMYDRLVDEVWVSDRQLADETSLRYVTLGSHYDLGELYSVDKKLYDFTHMSSLQVMRRQTIINKLPGLSIGPNCWPPERDEVLKKSKFGLNIHQDNHPFIEPLRFALFAAYGLPIITETSINIYPYEDVVLSENYDLLAGFVESTAKNYKDDPQRFITMGMSCRFRMCEEYRFDKMVKQAVEQSVGWR